MRSCGCLCGTSCALPSFPANKHSRNNFVTTSLQRRCNITTLQRRCNDVVVTLCVCWVVILFLYLVGPIRHYDHLAGKQGDTQRAMTCLHNVASTSMQRHDVPNALMTFIQRLINVEATSCLLTLHQR